MVLLQFCLVDVDCSSDVGIGKVHSLINAILDPVEEVVVMRQFEHDPKMEMETQELNQTTWLACRRRVEAEEDFNGPLLERGYSSV
jgi:hypothetical protein